MHVGAAPSRSVSFCASDKASSMSSPTRRTSRSSMFWTLEYRHPDPRADKHGTINGASWK